MLRLLLISPVDKKKHTCCCLETNNLLLYKFTKGHLKKPSNFWKKAKVSLSYHHPGFERLCLCFDSFYTFATSRNYIITLQECPHLWSRFLLCICISTRHEKKHNITIAYRSSQCTNSLRFELSPPRLHPRLQHHKELGPFQHLILLRLPCFHSLHQPQPIYKITKQSSHIRKNQQASHLILPRSA